MEGMAVLLISIYFYAVSDFSWVLFFVLLLAPDLSMLGYLKHNQFGAVIYNVFHTYVFPIVLVLVGISLLLPTLLAIGLIWFAHIGIDRSVGYGLKYPTAFKDTHLQRV
ncbi:DUF4260 domain-containing protein [Virgibacillus tibetensis]